MSIDLTNDNLLKTVGKSVTSSHGEFLGRISEVIRDEAENYVSYLILKSSNILDPQTRFFAIPASTAFIKISEAGKPMLQLNKNALHFVKQTSAQAIFQSGFKNNTTIYELL